jgi:selenocysteine lyase/cysteine desulfurase
LPEDVEAAKLRSALLAKHKINIRAVDTKQWNGLRASLHRYNDEAQAARLLEALEQVLTS